MTSTTSELPDQGNFHERVAEEIRVILVRRQIRASELARTLGWTENYISRRLTGKIPFDVNDLGALAALLGVPVTSFFPDSILTGGSLPKGAYKQRYVPPMRPVTFGMACTNVSADPPATSGLSRAA